MVGSKWPLCCVLLGVGVGVCCVVSVDTNVTDRPSLVITSLLTSCIQGGGEGHIIGIPRTKNLRDERLTDLSLFIYLVGGTGDPKAKSCYKCGQEATS